LTEKLQYTILPSFSVKERQSSLIVVMTSLAIKTW